jgi:hypothetical protein
MCLGSIAHLQYYFARTGLLDGKSARLARPGKDSLKKEVPRLMLTPDIAEYAEDVVDSPVDEDDEVMLPPTVSTYSVKTHYIPPPPKLQTLRKDLVEALDRASLSVQNADSCDGLPRDIAGKSARPSSLSPDHLSGTGDSNLHHTTANSLSWYEIQGMHILDLVTLAIRAARIYYTSHERPARLAHIKSEKKIRKELLAVLDVLKAWATRDFAGGLRNEERAAILGWMSGVLLVLDEERRLEAHEAAERASWAWAEGDWSGREREREEAFLQTLMSEVGPPLPAWTAPDDGPLPSPFLERLRDGRDLVRMHNQAIRKSKRLFGEIKAFHEDIAKPYRRAENIRYWKKASEIRWETPLELDVMGVVYGSSDRAWKQFDDAIRAWSRAVRQELVSDWRYHSRQNSVATIVPPEAELNDTVSATS